MKMGTVVIVRVVMSITGETIDECSCASTAVILPRVGEYLELETTSGEKLYRVTEIGHKYTTEYRNVISLYVGEVHT